MFLFETGEKKKKEGRIFKIFQVRLKKCRVLNNGFERVNPARQDLSEWIWTLDHFDVKWPCDHCACHQNFSWHLEET